MRECREANHSIDKARKLQRALYRAAKRSASRRFHALYDKVYRKDILGRAWELVRANRGTAGMDDQSIQSIENEGVREFLAQIQQELEDGRYHPRPIQRVYITKPDGRNRPLGIPVVRDRVVQIAVKIAVEPVFEADFQPCSFGFRPKRSAHDANEVIRQTVNRGFNWVVDTDIENYFDTIDQEKLMGMVSKRISDRRMLKLIRKFLTAGVLEEGKVRTLTAGTPQGGVLSPLLANIYLNYLDRVWMKRCRKVGILVRYADDLVAICPREENARKALKRMKLLMKRLGLKLNPDKTQFVNLREGQQGFDFLGFHHRKVRSYRYGYYYLHRWPGRKAMQAIREKIRSIVGERRGLNRTLKEVIAELNPVLRGWGNYFAVGNSSQKLSQIDDYVRERLYLFLSKKYGKSGRGWFERWNHINFRKEGLYQLRGTVRRHEYSANALG